MYESMPGASEELVQSLIDHEIEMTPNPLLEAFGDTIGSNCSDDI